MDKVYLSDIPRFEAALKALKREFSEVSTSSNWPALRIDPLIQHVQRLGALVSSPEFAPEVARLRKGVAMFRSDLVYLRTNIQVLRDILAAAKKRQTRKT
jgi:hypothetical protein